MTRLCVLASRLLALFTRRRRDADLHDEIQAHLDALTEDYVRKGMSLRQARVAARRDFGGVEQVKEIYRDQRSLLLVESLLRDIRHAVRAMRRAPVFTAVVVLTFALGVGAVTAIFAIVNSVLLKPLPYPNALRVVQLVQTLQPYDAGRKEPDTLVALTSDQLQIVRARSRTLSHLASYGTLSMTLTGPEEPVRVVGGRVSSGFFEVFGVRPMRGRAFTIEDERPGAPSVVILNHRMWTERFGQDPEIVGKTITLNSAVYHIVGVMPAGFSLPTLNAASMGRTDSGRLDDALEFWVPLTLVPPSNERKSGFTMLPGIASVSDGVNLQQAAAEVTSLMPPLPDGRRPTRVDLDDLRARMVMSVKPTLVVFQISVLFVLLIACANVANLLLARASRRRRELAIRLALGASRLQAAREAIIEWVLLAIGGSLLGGAIAWAVVRSVRALPPGLVPRFGEIQVDLTAAGFALAVSATAGLIVGAFVTLRVFRVDVWTGLRDGSGSMNAARSTPSPVLVVTQVAAALVLLVGAGLLLNSFVRLARRDLGFETRSTLTLRLTIPPNRFQRATAPDFYTRLVESLGTVSGVEAAAAGTALPFQQDAITFSPAVIGGQRLPDTILASTLVTPGYFRALRVPLLKGREFLASDRADTPRVVIVSQGFVSRYLSAVDPLEQDVQILGTPTARIVGVVPDAVRSLAILPTGPRAQVYFPIAQPPTEGAGLSSMGLVLRTTRNPFDLIPAVRRSVAALDPTLPIYGATTVEQLLSESLAVSRLYGIGAGAFAVTALLLAIIGLYGVIAYSVGSRTQEFGVRMALGADAGRLIRHVLGQGARLVAMGLALGVAGAWAATRSLQGLLFGVTPTDATTLVSVTALFLVVASIACWVPARRASRVDPLVALRHE